MATICVEVKRYSRSQRNAAFGRWRGSVGKALSIYQKNKNKRPTETCIRIFIAGLLIRAQNEKKKMSINRLMDKQIIVYTYNGIFLSNKKE